MNLKRLCLATVFLPALLRGRGPLALGASPAPQKSHAATAGTQTTQPAKDAAAGTNQPLTAPLEVRVPVEPWAFRANNRWNLVYELHIANIGNEDCALTRVEVLGQGSHPKLLARMGGSELDAAIAHPWVDVSDPATLRPATVAVVFMWVSIADGDDLPESLLHRITMRVGGYPEELSITMPSLNVNRTPVPVIGPPLRGGDWGAAHGPDNGSRHRRGLLTIEGRSYIAERYAIDWLRITPTGDVHSGSGSENKDFPGYGAEVIAVADGVVTEVLDGVRENLPGQPPSVPITLRTLCGNHIIEQVGTNLYASYCHLQPGIKVQSGTRVKRGQLLGLVGNSGNSDAPHLHFHLCNANSTLACEGVPYAFSSFIEEHRSFNSSDKAKVQPDTKHSMEMPLNETLVDFD